MGSSLSEENNKSMPAFDYVLSEREIILFALFVFFVILSGYFYYGKQYYRSNVYELIQEIKVAEAVGSTQERIIAQTRDQVREAMESTSARALSQNSSEFLKLAELSFQRLSDQANHQLNLKQNAIDQLVAPLKQSLSQVDLKLRSRTKKNLGL